MWSAETTQLIRSACAEDLGSAGDITAALLPDRDVDVTARVVPREAGVICGLTLTPEICRVFAERLNAALVFTASTDVADGDSVNAGQTVATLQGPKAVVLATERTLLNFLGRMSGVATLTRQHVDAARAVNPEVQILDTRKTIPGWRELDKYAVTSGGGHNHRTGLYDAVLIKDNHLAGIPAARLAGKLFELLNRAAVLSKTSTCQTGGPAAPKASVTAPGAQTEPDAQARDKPTDASGTRSLPVAPGPASPPFNPKFIEVEVDSLDQLTEACKVVGVDMILLDNFSLEDMKAGVTHRDEQGLRGKVALEASGGVTLETIADIAATGVDRISVGALTHSAASLDIGLDL